MKEKKRTPIEGKSKLHPRNKHQGSYNFDTLVQVFPELQAFVKKNRYQNLSIDFANPEAVKALNTALLFFHYKLDYWDIPPHYLCPPIPGRADYIHHIADLLGANNQGNIPAKIKVLDIGVGANCIYPILGNREYNWTFVGSDIDPISIHSARQIVDRNSLLKGKIELRLQQDRKRIFQGVLKTKEFFDLSICNPPFHASAKDSQSATHRKLKNLKLTTKNPVLNFGGGKNELWCDGGELKFIQSMIKESILFSQSIFWFSTLVSKQSNLHPVYASLKKAKVNEIHTLPMGQGNKTSRIVAWTFLNQRQKKNWIARRW